MRNVKQTKTQSMSLGAREMELKTRSVFFHWIGQSEKETLPGAGGEMERWARILYHEGGLSARVGEHSNHSSRAIRHSSRGNHPTC